MMNRKAIAESDLNNDNLQELINKHNLLQDELKQVNDLYNMYFDSNFIFQKLSQKEPLYLAQFIKLLNTTIIDRMKNNN